jgi:hypothetical protein
MRRDAQRKEIFPISTPFIIPKWEAVVKECGLEHTFADVIYGLHNGFSLGLEDFNVQKTFSPDCHERVDFSFYILSRTFTFPFIF